MDSLSEDLALSCNSFHQDLRVVNALGKIGSSTEAESHSETVHSSANEFMTKDSTISSVLIFKKMSKIYRYPFDFSIRQESSNALECTDVADVADALRLLE